MTIRARSSSQHTLVVLAIVTPLLLAASPQDSVSKVAGLPGDALDATDVAEQRNNYVVDLSVLTSSWGAKYGVAPIAKSSRTNSPLPPFPGAYFNNRMSSSTLSRELLTDRPFAATSYAHWTAAGFGVHDDPAYNDPGTPVDATGRIGAQFAFAFSDYATSSLIKKLQPEGDGGSLGGPALSIENNVVGGLVHYSPETPSRLYVSRVTAATNSPSGTCSDVEFGLGAVDADGNVHFRGDDFGLSPCLNPVTGNNLYRVDMATRSGALVNHISGLLGSGDPTATARLLTSSMDVHLPPNNLLFPGLVPVLATSNFLAQYVREASAGSLTASSAHFAPGVVEQRGAVGRTSANFPMFPGADRGTAAVLAKDGAGKTRVINVWGLGAGAAPIAPRAMTLPPVDSACSRPIPSSPTIEATCRSEAARPRSRRARTPRATCCSPRPSTTPTPCLAPRPTST